MIKITLPSRRTMVLASALLSLAAISWTCLQACSIAASDLVVTVDRRPMLKSLRDTVIIPYASRFADKAATLETTTAKLAAHPTSALLDSAKTAWKGAALAWASLQAMRVGPTLDQTPRVDFWPTRPNLIEQSLSATDPLDSNRLASLTPSAGKGLPALEWLLFSQPSDSVLIALSDSVTGPRRSAYLAAVASDIHSAATEILAGWKGSIGSTFVDAASGSRYPTSQAAVEELINGLVSTLESMKTSKVQVPAGVKNDGRPQPDAIESPYAGLSLDILSANLDGLEAAFKGQVIGGTGAGAGTGLDKYMRDLGSDVPASIDRDIADSRSALAAVPAPLATAVTNRTDKVIALGGALKNLVVAVKNDVTSTLGFTITFSDSDGD